MKIGGQDAAGPKKGLIVIERSTARYVFHFTAVLDDSEFEKLFPEPKPPRSWKKEAGGVVDNVLDPTYLKAREKWAESKSDWYFLKSIEESKIEWDSVKMDDPTTWGNWKKDFKAAGFSSNEIRAIENEFYKTNVVTEEMLNEARGRFLASQAMELLAEQLSPASESLSSESSEPAKGSESSHPASVPPG